MFKVLELFLTLTLYSIPLCIILFIINICLLVKIRIKNDIN